MYTLPHTSKTAMETFFSPVGKLVCRSIFCFRNLTYGYCQIFTKFDEASIFASTSTYVAHCEYLVLLALSFAFTPHC